MRIIAWFRFYLERGVKILFCLSNNSWSDIIDLFHSIFAGTTCAKTVFNASTYKKQLTADERRYTPIYQRLDTNIGLTKKVKLFFE